MIQCPYCLHVTEAPEMGFPETCPECFCPVEPDMWQWLEEDE